MLLICIFDKDNQYIHTLDENFKVINCVSIDKNLVVFDMIFNPCKKEKLEFIEYFVFKKGCYSYVCQCPFDYCNLVYELCYCNYKIREKYCEINYEKGCYTCSQIIESIALVEASLAHILNAEGDKIKKVISTTNNINEIICVNEQVIKVITKITHLEQVLYEKLDTIKNCNLYSDKCKDNNNDVCDDVLSMIMSKLE